MKKVNDILTHLKYNPEFKKINTNDTLDKLTNALPAKLRKGIKFSYIKRQTLFFVLTHPVYKMEFEYNKSLIKSLLKSANIANVDDIQFFVTNKMEKKEEVVITEENTPFFKEKSYGLFENHSKDEKIFKAFEAIRNIIKTS